MVPLRNVLAGVLIVALPLILLLSNRHWVLSDQHRAVAHVSEIPTGRPGTLLADLPSILHGDGIHVPRMPSMAQRLYTVFAATGYAPAARVIEATDSPRYGYSVREWSFFGMPFGWYEEHGYVVYSRVRSEYGSELVMAPLIPAADAQLMQEVGRDLKQGFLFPFWAHAWGWIYVALVALWGWLYHRSVMQWRRAEGIL